MARRRRYTRKRRQGQFSFLYKILIFVAICGAIGVALALFFKVETVTVTGLITGGDLKTQLADAPEQEILLCGNTLRSEGDLFLDDMPLDELRAVLAPRKLTIVPNTGAALLSALRGSP